MKRTLKGLMIWSVLAAMLTEEAVAQNSPALTTQQIDDYNKKQRLSCTTQPRPSSGPSLAMRFAELEAFEPTQAQITHSWSGLSLFGPMHSEYTLDLDGDRFKGTAYVGVISGTATSAALVRRNDVMTFARAVLGTAVEEGPYEPRICHTDDYPSLEIRLQNGRQKLRIWSTSQELTPWGIEFDNRSFVAETPELGKALEPLMIQLDWKGSERRLLESTNPMARSNELRKKRLESLRQQTNP
jgi:hypothetical protein